MVQMRNRLSQLFTSLCFTHLLCSKLFKYRSQVRVVKLNRREKRIANKSLAPSHRVPVLLCFLNFEQLIVVNPLIGLSSRELQLSMDLLVVNFVSPPSERNRFLAFRR